MIIKALSLITTLRQPIAEGKKTIEIPLLDYALTVATFLSLARPRAGAEEPKGVALASWSFTDIRPHDHGRCAGRMRRLIYPRAQAWIITNLRVLKTTLPSKASWGCLTFELPDDL